MYELVLYIYNIYVLGLFEHEFFITFVICFLIKKILFRIKIVVNFYHYDGKKTGKYLLNKFFEQTSEYSCSFYL